MASKKSSKAVPWSLIKIVVLAVVFVGALGAGYYGYTQGLLGKVGESISEITAPAPEPQGPQKIKVLQPGATLKRGEQETNIAEGTEQDLQINDKITTSGTGVVMITYPSGTVVRLGPSTEVTFVGPNNLAQTIGKVFVRFRKLVGVQEEFEVETDGSVAAVRGSAFASILKKDADQRVLVSDDEIEVTPKSLEGIRQNHLKTVIKKGEEVTISRKLRTLSILPQKLNLEEAEWLDFNKKSDEDPTRTFMNLYKSLTIVRATPTPVTTASGTAKPTSTPVPLTAIGAMPGAGYTKNSVTTTGGTFTFACYGADKGSVRMLTDSASDSDCTNNCPVMNLADYATRNGGVAAMNGMYFCPADYAACAGKVNSFDTLFFNSRTHNYMNSANNVYSSIPFVGMNADHSLNFVGASSSWGRDTGIIGGTAGNPLLTNGGGYAVNEGGLDDKQRNVKSNRGAIAQKGSMIYLCIVQGATVIDSGHVFATLGADNAINVDGGGSSALWVGGSYKYGPGRQIPSAIILAP